MFKKWTFSFSALEISFRCGANLPDFSLAAVLSFCVFFVIAAFFRSCVVSAVTVPAVLCALVLASFLRLKRVDSSAARLAQLPRRSVRLHRVRTDLGQFSGSLVARR